MPELYTYMCMYVCGEYYIFSFSVHWSCAFEVHICKIPPKMIMTNLRLQGAFSWAHVCMLHCTWRYAVCVLWSQLITVVVVRLFPDCVVTVTPTCTCTGADLQPDLLHIYDITHVYACTVIALLYKYNVIWNLCVWWNPLCHSHALLGCMHVLLTTQCMR